MISEVVTVSGFAALQWRRWSLYVTHLPSLGDGWSRWTIKVGPLLLSFSLAEVGDD